VNTRNSFSFAILLIGAIGTWYLARTLQSDEVKVHKTQLLQNGFYLKSARIFGTAIDGQLLYEIEAEYAEQLGAGELEFQNVEISYSSETDVPWILSADKALIGKDRDLIKLSGHVVVTSSEGFSGDVTEIRTPYLELEPDDFRAKTDQRVQVRIGARSITAIGMLAMLQTNQLQLKSNISGKFVP
jgi:lipopolysaccharide export system protein LptC